MVSALTLRLSNTAFAPEPPNDSTQKQLESKMLRPKMMIAWGLIVAVSAIANSALAQKPSSVNAATQARDRMFQSHRQTGTIGGGYRPYSAWSYTEAARTHAQALASHGEACPNTTPETAREHLTEIRRNLAAAQKETAKFADDAAKQADVKMHLDAMKKHQDTTAKLCDRMEKAIGTDKVDCAEVCACCDSIDKELSAAEVEHRALLEKVGIKHPAAAAKATQPPEDAPKSK